MVTTVTDRIARLQTAAVVELGTAEAWGGVVKTCRRLWPDEQALKDSSDELVAMTHKLKNSADGADFVKEISEMFADEQIHMAKVVAWQQAGLQGPPVLTGGDADLVERFCTALIGMVQVERGDSEFPVPVAVKILAHLATSVSGTKPEAAATWTRMSTTLKAASKLNDCTTAFKAAQAHGSGDVVVDPTDEQTTSFLAAIDEHGGFLDGIKLTAEHSLDAWSNRVVESARELRDSTAKRVTAAAREAAATAVSAIKDVARGGEGGNLWTDLIESKTLLPSVLVAAEKTLFTLQLDCEGKATEIHGLCEAYVTACGMFKQKVDKEFETDCKSVARKLILTKTEQLLARMFTAENELKYTKTQKEDKARTLKKLILVWKMKWTDSVVQPALFARAQNAIKQKGP